MFVGRRTQKRNYLFLLFRGLPDHVQIALQFVRLYELNLSSQREQRGIIPVMMREFLYFQQPSWTHSMAEETRKDVIAW